VPNDIEFDAQTGDYHVLYSSLCKFNPDQLGDDVINSSSNVQTPIHVSYKTVPTFDLGNPQKKIFKRLKIFGTTSAFWQPRQSETEKPPLLLTPYGDFRVGQQTRFMHAFDGDSLSRRILKKHFNGVHFSKLSSKEIKDFWKIYKAEADMITQISLPLITMPSTRFGLQIDMDIMEAYVSIYGFDVFYDQTAQIM
jgi:hypothetical protein